METSNELVPVTPQRSPMAFSRYIESEGTKLLRDLNLKLQYEKHTLENEVGRLKQEVQSYKGKSYIYDSLTKDLASLRTQLDKTALALLKKCEAYDALKKEMVVLKMQHNISPKSSHQKPINLNSPQKQSAGNVKRKLAIYQDIMDMSDTESIISVSRRCSRPSMGSCGNLVKQISVEESMPSCLQMYATSAAPLRNKVLMKLHTLRAASTESLESVGRKSIKVQEAIGKPSKQLIQPRKNFKPTLDSSTQSSKIAVLKAPPSIRPALGQNNGRVIKMNTSLKKSNSSCSSKSASSRPAFRL